MKMLFLSHEYPPIGGGGANACRNLAMELSRRGHRIHVVTAGFKGLPAKEQAGSGSSGAAGELRIYRVDSRRKAADHSTGTEMFDYLRKAFPLLRTLINDGAYDVCLCFFGIPSGPMALRLQELYGLPYVIRMGGGDIPGFQDRFHLLYRVLSPELKRIWKHADGLVANSSGLKKLALDFCAEHPIQVICNGVDTELFRPEKEAPAVHRGSEDGRSAIHLVTASRLIRRKGLQDVIPYVRALEEDTGRRISWTIAGDGPYRQELETLTEDCGAADQIRFIGARTRDELAHLYRQADLFVFPSFREGMPNVVLEAMAAGLPVVMRADCQGAMELIHGNGAAAEGRFIEGLRDILLQDDDELRRMGTISRERVLERFTWDRIADQYESVLEEAAGAW